MRTKARLLFVGAILLLAESGWSQTEKLPEGGCLGLPYCTPYGDACQATECTPTLWRTCCKYDCVRPA